MVLGVSIRQSIAILGVTGSVGSSCVDVVRQHASRLRIAGMTAWNNQTGLEELSSEFQPDWAVLGNGQQSGDFARNCPDTEWFGSFADVERLVRGSGIDKVVCATTGLGALCAIWAVVDSGKALAIANKEALVVAGPLVMQRAAETGSCVIPVDSEHSAIFQCLNAGRKQDVRKVVLTASGGPFRGWSREQLRDVTPTMALRHPTWQMGQKITIDSATMMNKALEIVEARWLFGLTADQIGVVIHPQSIAHSFVEFLDGSVICQISPPDMRLPLQYALLFPERQVCAAPGMDWTSPISLEFNPPDIDVFPALRLGFEVAASGGTSGAVLNAANEVAVDRFLNRDLRFDQITEVVESVLSHHQFESQPSLTELLRIDDWARKEAARWT
jgi:1-deoxy-D-xylulose-5-phosphate reductoisomerase